MQRLALLLCTFVFTCAACSKESEPKGSNTVSNAPEKTPKVQPVPEPSAGNEETIPEDETAVPPINVEESEEINEEDKAEETVPPDTSAMESELIELENTRNELELQNERNQNIHDSLKELSDSVEAAMGAAIEATMENAFESITLDMELVAIEGIEDVLEALLSLDQQGALQSFGEILSSLMEEIEKGDKEIDEIDEEIKELKKKLADAKK